MSARDRALAARWEMATPAHHPDPEMMVVERLAEADPVRAIRALAAGLVTQTPGSQVACLRLLAAALVKRNPEIAGEIAEDLRDLCGADRSAP